MNIRDLKYLLALEEHQHFGKAASACFVSQPGLSMQIQKLEEDLEVQLIERTNKSLEFTEVGLKIVERAHNILNQVEEIRDLAKQAKDPYSGELTLGIFPTLAPYFLPHIVPELSKQYRKLSFYLIEEKTDNLIDALRKGKIQAAFLALPIEEKNFKTMPLFEEEFLLAAPHHHPFSNIESIHASNIHNQELFLLEEGHCLREQALSFCLKANAMECQNFRATSIETLRLMVASGIGMTLIPKLACDNNENIAYIPFHDPKPVRSVGLTWRKMSAKSVLLEEIADSIKNILRKKNILRIL
jgi:LysR family hydrogen peroxide-inducible transcriptional activator